MSRVPARPVGHERVIGRLAAVATEAGSRLPHAALFTGPAGVGKWHSARWWVRTLKCREAAHCEPACPDCKRVGAGSHADVLELEPETDGKSIKIESVREMIRLMSLKCVSTGPRVALVRDAHQLTFEAQSALLKILEEPPGSALIVLVTENPAALLATVRSRCQTFRFGALAVADIEALLVAAGKDRDVARRAACLAKGRVALALDYSAELVADRDQLIASFEALRSADGTDPEPLVAALVERRKDGGPGLEEMLDWTLERIEAALGFAPAAESDALSTLLDGSTPADVPRLLARADAIQRTLDALDRNANAKLAIRDMLLDRETR